MQRFFSSASQMQGSPQDDPMRPSLGDTPTDLNKLLLGETTYISVLSSSKFCFMSFSDFMMPDSCKGHFAARRTAYGFLF